MVKCPTAESGDLLGVRGREVDAAGSALVLAVRVHGAGGLVYGLVDDVVLQLRGVAGMLFMQFKFPLDFTWIRMFSLI